MVVSHADVDHYNVLPTLFERFRVNQLLVSPTMRYDSSMAVKTLFDAAGRSGVRFGLVSIGQTPLGADRAGYKCCIRRPKALAPVIMPRASCCWLNFAGTRFCFPAIWNRPDWKCLVEAADRFGCFASPTSWVDEERPDQVLVSHRVGKRFFGHLEMTQPPSNRLIQRTEAKPQCDCLQHDEGPCSLRS